MKAEEPRLDPERKGPGAESASGAGTGLGVVSTDAAGRITSLNQAAERLAGCTGAEARSRPFDQVFPMTDEETGRPRESPVARILREGEARSAEDVLVVARDGREAAVAAMGAAIRGDDSSLLGIVVVLRDRTAERAAQEVMAASEIRYRRLFEAAQDGILILDAETGVVLDANPFLLALIGMSMEQLLDKAIWELGFLKDVAASMEKFLELQRRQYVRYENLPLRTTDGREVHVEFVSNVYAEDGRKVIQCNIRDVTVHKRNEDELIRLRQAAHASSDAIFMTGVDGIITFVNPWFTRLYGFSAEDVVGKATPRILKGGDMSEEVYASFWRAILAKQPVSHEIINRTKDGRRVAVEATANAILDEEGRIVGFLAIQRDITERRRAEEALRRSEAFNRSLLDHLPQRIFLKDRGSTYVSCNDHYANDLGISPEQIVGKDDFDFHDPELARAYRADDQLVMSSGRPKQTEEPYTVGGAQRWISTTKVPYHDDRGQVVGVLGIFEDITDRRRSQEAKEKLEEQLRGAQKLEAVGSLAGGIAHDFNNLLSVILSYTTFALENVREGDPLRDDLQEVRNAGERAAALTRQLLAFSRKQILQSRPLALNQVIAGIEKMMGRIIGEDIDLTTILAPDLCLTLADPGQIEQVLMNLVVNARDAMPTGGTITIETSNVEGGEDAAGLDTPAAHGPHVALVVTDTGIGMDEQTRARVFEPFFTTKEAGRGTGLGLSTVYGIIKQSGGDIRVYSAPGRGTTFKIILPAAVSAVEARTWTPKVTARTEGTETILVTEDEDAVRNLAKRILANAGYTVITAANAGEALLACEAHPGKIHLLVTDVVMPRMSGMALAQRLALSCPDLKVLYMSGYADSSMANYGALGKAAHYIAKPFNAPDLTRKVREALDDAARGASSTGAPESP